VLFFAFLFYPSFLLFSCSRPFLNSYFLYVIYVCLPLSFFLCHFWMFASSCSFLFLTSFIRSISCVISSFLTFCLGCLRLPWLNGGNGTHSATVERRFYNESLTLVNVYGCPIASRNCRSLSLGAKCFGGAGGSGWCHFKGVLRFIASDTKVTPSQNIFALMK